MKKKLVNFRAVFVFAAVLALGLFYAKDIISGEVGGIIVVALTLGLFVFWAIKDRAWVKFVVPFVALVVGIGLFVVCDTTYFRGVTTGGEYEVCGRVEQINNDYGTAQSFVLGDVEIEGKNQSKNIFIYIQLSGKGVEIGDKIKFVGTLDKVDLWGTSGFNSFYYKNKIASFCRLYSSDIQKQGNDKKISEKFQSIIKNKLDSQMTDQNATIAYASIFGDKAGIDEEVKDAFSGVGIAHLLAISGLHIGFFVGLLSFILSKCRLRKKWHVLVIAPILFIYCYLCRFSPSVLRATIMSTMGLIGYCFGRKNDALTTFSVALIVCLIFRPLDIFDGGLQLSFLCVFSLILLSPIIQCGFEKIRLQKLGKVISPVLAVQIGILPVMLKLFKSISFLTIFANMVCVPVFEIAYISLMVILPISFIPHLGLLLIVPEFLLHSIAITAITLSENSAVLSLPYLGKDVSFMYIFLMFGLSRFVMTNANRRLLLVVGLVVVMSFVFFASYYQNVQDDNSVLVVGQSDIFVICDNSSKYLVNLSDDFEDAENELIAILRNRKIYRIDHFITTSLVDKSSFSQLRNAEIIIGENEYVKYYKIKNETKAIKISTSTKTFLFFLSLDDGTEKQIVESMFEEETFDVVINLTDQNVDPKTKLVIDKNKLGDDNWTISFDGLTFGKKRRLV